MGEPLFELELEDGTKFVLPEKWEDVFVDYFGEGENGHAVLAERLKFLVGKYVAHRAFPSKFDGIGMDEEQSDRQYDDPDFYFESWDEWGAEWRKWGDHVIQHPTHADIAEGLLYQGMRSGLMQKALEEMTPKGKRVPRVITPKQFLEELGEDKDDSVES